MDDWVQKRRRTLGVIFLLTALAMLVAGETLLRDRFTRFTFVLYWAGCFVFTFLAIVVALLDVSAIRSRSRGEQRAFLEQTLREISEKQRSHPKSERVSKNPISSKEH